MSRPALTDWHNLPARDTPLDRDALRALEAKVYDYMDDLAAASMFGQLEVYGHSIPYGQTAGNPTRSYVQRVASMLHVEAAPFSIGGSILSWHDDAIGTAGNGGWAHIYRTAATGTRAKNATAYTGAPYEAMRDLALLQFGINDLATLGTANLAPFTASLKAVISRLRAAYIFEDDDASAAYTGSWTTVAASLSDGTLYGSNGSLKYSSTNGDKVTITVPGDYDGSPIALAFVAGSTGTGALWDIRVDGSLVGSIDNRNGHAQDYGTGLHGHTTPWIYRLTNLAAGAHTITATINTVTGAAFFDCWWIEAGEPPLIPVVKQHTPTTYAGFAAFPFNAAAGLNDAAVATLNAAIQTVVDGFDDDVFTITPPALAAGDMTDGLHPNVRGHGLYADAVIGPIIDAARARASHARSILTPSFLSQTPGSYYRNLVIPGRPDVQAAVWREHPAGTLAGVPMWRIEDKTGALAAELMPGGIWRFGGDDSKRLVSVGAGGIGSTGALSSFAATLNQILIDHTSGFPKISIPIGTADPAVSLNLATLDLYHVLNALVLTGGQYLSLARAAATHQADALGNGIGDKLALFGTTLAARYGFGVQASALVAYVPSGARLSARQTQSSGQASGGSTLAKVEGADPTAAQDFTTKAFVDPAFTDYKILKRFTCFFGNSTAQGTYLLADLGTTAGILPSANNFSSLAMFTFDPARWPVPSGKTLKLRLIVDFFVNNVAPGASVSIRFGLYPVTNSNSAAVAATIGTVVAGSQPAAVAPPTAGQTGQSDSTDFTAPGAAGAFAVGMILSGAALAANSYITLEPKLLVTRN